MNARLCRIHCFIAGYAGCILCPWQGDQHAGCFEEIHWACAFPAADEWRQVKVKR